MFKVVSKYLRYSVCLLAIPCGSHVECILNLSQLLEYTFKMDLYFESNTM